MENNYNFQQSFNKSILIDKKINHKEFEDCNFKNCDFSNSDFSNNTFIDCEFVDCNLSMLKLSQTSLKNVTFKNCKLLGIHFNECNDFLFEVFFQDCVLDYASFSNKKMPKTKFINSSLIEVSFIKTIINNAIFDNCNLMGTLFNDSNISNSDFSTAYNYKIDPEFNTVKKAKFSANGLAGLLDKYDIIID